jgi:mannose-6-phosphate isomerase-like protein (cupin superfamily)
MSLRTGLETTLPDSLRTGGPSDIALDLARTPGLWEYAVRFRSDRHEHTQILVGPDVEAWLLTWLPGQSTGLHDHGGSAGAFTVIRGRLHETLPAADTTADPVRHALAAGAVRTFGPAHVHAVANLGQEPAVSLHVYAPRLHMMTRYSLVAGLLEVTGVERAGADW